MSKFTKPDTHHFGCINPHMERINFHVLADLDNMTAKAPIYREMPVNPFANTTSHCKPCDDPSCDKPSSDEPCDSECEKTKPNQSEEEQSQTCCDEDNNCVEIFHMYKQVPDDEIIGVMENPQISKPPEEPKTNISRFIKRQSAIRW